MGYLNTDYSPLLMVAYNSLNLSLLPSHEFCVLLSGSRQRDLIELAANILSEGRQWGKYKRLAFYLSKKVISLQDISCNSIADNYIPNWKTNKKFLPLDCYYKLSTLTGIKSHPQDISLVKCKAALNRTAIEFPFVYNEDLAFLGEAIRVEGHIKSNFYQSTISNKNLAFLDMIKKVLVRFVPSSSVYETYSIEADIPDKEMKLINSHMNCSRYKASRSNKFKIRFYDNIERFPKTYHLTFDSGFNLTISISIIGDELVGTSDYGIVSPVRTLALTNITFNRILNIFLDIPCGKKSDIIKIPLLLMDSPPTVKIAAINAVLCSESGVEDKRVRILMNSRHYIDDLRVLFIDLGIPVLVRETCLSITGRKNLQKVAESLNFISTKKQKKMKTNLLSYKRDVFQKGEALKEILLALKEKDYTTLELSQELNKHKDTIQHHLQGGIKENFIKKDSISWPYKYSITPEGSEYLGRC